MTFKLRFSLSPRSFLEWLTQQRAEYSTAQRLMAAREAEGAEDDAPLSEEAESALLDRLEDAQKQLAQVRSRN